MTFAEVLPALREGRKARNLDWPVNWKPVSASDHVAQIGMVDLMSSNWELVDEPAGMVDKLLRERDATIARLERDLRDVSGAHAAQQETNHHLERDLTAARDYLIAEGARADRLERELVEAKRSRCCSCCSCGRCVYDRQNDALGSQGRR